MDLTKFLVCSADLNMGTISCMTHIKTLLSFLPGTDKHFIGNASSLHLVEVRFLTSLQLCACLHKILNEISQELEYEGH